MLSSRAFGRGLTADAARTKSGAQFMNGALRSSRLVHRPRVSRPGLADRRHGQGARRGVSGGRAVFAEVDEALGENLSKLIFEGPEAELTLTANAQPALMATSLAALRALETEAGFDVARDAAFVAGHSLGEYSALCAAGALTPRGRREAAAPARDGDAAGGPRRRRARWRRSSGSISRRCRRSPTRRRAISISRARSARPPTTTAAARW